MQNHVSADVEAYLSAQLEPTLNQAPEEDGVHFFGLRSGDIGILLDEAVSKELVALENLRTIPNAPDWLLGFTNIRSTIMPVVSLSNLIQPSLPPASQKDLRYLLAIGSGSSGVAVPAFDFPRKLRLSDEQQYHQRELIPERLHDFIVNSYLVDGIPWVQLQLYEFLSTYTRTDS